MGLLDDLSDESVWQQFYEYRKAKAHWSKRDDEFFLMFIREKRYLPLASLVAKGTREFSYPTKKLVNKLDTGKKRVVYSFATEENMLLKLMSFLLYRYDDAFADNLYSFRKDFGVMRAIRRLTGHKGIDEMYCYKLDVSNYFNSIDSERLIGQLSKLLRDTDPALFEFLSKLLTADHAYSEGSLIEEKRGAMAGIPISPFFANLYLSELDKRFVMLEKEEGVLYARYSDDIIVFAPTQELLEMCVRVIHELLERYHLQVNPSKEAYFLPHERWEFLGIAYEKGEIDLSLATVKKMQGKIRRKAKALYRWGKRKGATSSQTQKVMIRVFNEKFFECRESHELNWSHWFFPLLTKTDGLHTIDLYLQQYIRFLGTGRHGKRNFATTYEMMKEMGYRSLVHEYYEWKNNED